MSSSHSPQVGAATEPALESSAALDSRIADLEARLAQKSAEVEALRQVGQAINLRRDLPLMMQSVADIIQRVTETDVCFIYLLNEAKTELTLRAASHQAVDSVGKVRIPLGVGITGWVALNRYRVAISRDAEKDSRFLSAPEIKQDRFESILSIPLMGQDDIIGVINIRTEEAHEYTEGQIEIVESVAAQVASAIESSEHLLYVERRASQLSTLSEISRTISSGLYLEEILQFVVAATARTLNLSICTVLLTDDDKKELVLKATTSQSRSYVKKPNVKIGESLAGVAAAEKRPVAVLDVKKMPGYRFPDIARQEGLCSLVCLPMILKGRVIGVLNCYTSRPHNFTDDEVTLLAALATQAAIAIENAQLNVRSAILQEMHHRVKNNLQTVASLLRLQLRYARGVTTESALTESIHRIQSIAVVHEMLSREDLDTVSVRKLAETILSAHSSSSLPVGHKVEMKVEGPDILLASHQATSVALVLNELVQNAIEHGLPHAEGVCRIGVQQQDGTVTVEVENSGNTLPPDFDMHKQRNLGLQIVENLVRDELGGVFELRGGETTIARFSFSH